MEQTSLAGWSVGWRGMCRPELRKEIPSSCGLPGSPFGCGGRREGGLGGSPGGRAVVVAGRAAVVVLWQLARRPGVPTEPHLAGPGGGASGGSRL